MDHHYGLSEKSIRNLNDLYGLILNGIIWHKEDDKHDQKITITIGVEDD